MRQSCEAFQRKNTCQFLLTHTSKQSKHTAKEPPKTRFVESETSLGFVEESITSKVSYEMNEVLFFWKFSIFSREKSV